MKEGLIVRRKNPVWVVERWVAGFPYGYKTKWTKDVSSLEEVERIAREEKLSVTFKEEKS